MGTGKRSSIPTGVIGCTEEAKSGSASCGIAQSEIYFRPQTAYAGEFGFDWMRLGDWTFNRTLRADDSFTDDKYSERVTATKWVWAPVPVAKQNAKRIAAYTKLEKEYGPLKVRNASYNYHVHWLAIFPKSLADSFNGSFAHPTGTQLRHQATLEVLIKIKDIANKPDRIIFLHKEPANIEVTTSASSDPNIAAFLPCDAITSTDKQILGQITVNSIGEFNDDVAIEAYAVKGGEKPTFAGVLMVCKNHSTKVCRRQNVLVALIKTKINGVRQKDGSDVFTDNHEQLIYYALHQSLLYGKVEKNQTIIDLTNSIRFRLRSSLTAPDSTSAEAEKFCSPAGVMPGNTRGNAFDYLNGLLPHSYQDYAKLFTFDESWAYDVGTSGVTKDFSSKIAANFSEISSFVTTPAHEMSHSMGLRHTFGDPNADFRFGEPISRLDQVNMKWTDNIMSYSDRRPAMTWHWQWKIMNKNLR